MKNTLSTTKRLIRDEHGMQVLHMLGIATVALLIGMVLITSAPTWGTSVSGEITQDIECLSGGGGGCGGTGASGDGDISDGIDNVSGDGNTGDDSRNPNDTPSAEADNDDSRDCGLSPFSWGGCASNAADWLSDRASDAAETAGNAWEEGKDRVNDAVETVEDYYDKAQAIYDDLSRVQWSDIIDTEGLEADWLRLYNVWFFERSPEDLGEWGERDDGTPVVTITSDDYVNDLKGRDAYQDSIDVFQEEHSNFDDISVGDTSNHLFRFTGPGTTTGDYDALEWFLGSYNTDVTVTSVNSETKEVTVRVVVSNLSHWESGTRVPQSAQDQGLPPHLIPNSPRDDFGPGGNVYQEFIWEDTIKYE